ncbi:MAG: zinc ribbon-containing protein [Gammaproteobacteria bacterium]|nr:zinc ribbon-containing protein [Gammaproteobacteria bacterium]MBU1625455.1 zinc ribbon-containing protein [Gammaproteobacteria bacterium]MBU1981715.1 zinc ribbon-containing protein [Gammaproteobacteria bacterium]
MSNSSKPEQAVQSPAADKKVSADESLYDRFAEKSSEIFEKGQEKGHEAWDKAMDLAREQMAAAGEFSSEQGEVFKRYLRRDLEQTVSDLNQLGKDAKENLNPARLGAGALSSLAKILRATGGALTALSNKTEAALIYQSGEITLACTLQCTSCGHKILLTKTSVVPTCPECQGTEFRKGY